MSLILGSKYIEEIKELNDLGYDIITFSPSETLNNEISSHADINVFKYDDTLFVNADIIEQIGECTAPYRLIPVVGISSPYPSDIKLNCAVIGNNILCNTNHVAKEILDFAERNDIHIIHTNQGYSKCSVCVLNDNAVITDDDGIACLLKNYQMDVLKISKGDIYLSDKHYGFIGGASGKLNDKEIYFSGDISAHPDYKSIVKFLNKYHIKPVFNKNRKLNDFGGFITI